MVEQGSMERFLSIFSSNRNDELPHSKAAGYPQESSSVNKTSRLAEEFYETVRSGRFTWMGLGETIDVLKRRRLVIYLVEGSAPQKPQASTFDSFVPLSWDLRLHGEFLDCYFMPPNKDKLYAEAAIEDMNIRYSSPDHDYKADSSLLFEETIIPPVFYQTP